MGVAMEAQQMDDVRAMVAAEKRLNAGRCSIVWTAVPTDGDPALRPASRCRMERVRRMADGAVDHIAVAMGGGSHMRDGMRWNERACFDRSPCNPRAIACKRATNMPARRCLCSIFRAVF